MAQKRLNKLISVIPLSLVIAINLALAQTSLAQIKTEKANPNEKKKPPPENKTAQPENKAVAPPSFFELNSAAIKAYSSGNLVEAESLFTKALTSKPPEGEDISNEIMLLTSLASVERDLGKTSKAKHTYSQAIKLATKSKQNSEEAPCLVYLKKQYAVFLRKIKHFEELDKLSQNGLAGLNENILKGAVETNVSKSSEDSQITHTETPKVPTQKVEEKKEITEISSGIETNSITGGISTISTNAPDTNEGIKASASTDNNNFANSGTEIALNTDLTSGLGQPSLTSEEDYQSNKLAEATGFAGGPKLDTYSQKYKEQYSIIIRLLHYLSSSEISFEALRSGIYWLDRGARVTVLLDREAIMMANRHNKEEWQVDRNSTQKFIKVQSLLNDFINKGGKVVASEKWIKEFELDRQNIPTGISLLSENDINDLIISNTGRIINY